MSQRLELMWPGKDKFLLVPKDENGKPVWVGIEPLTLLMPWKRPIA